MLVDNPYGILQGDTEDPQLIAYPRDGIPEVISTIDALKEAAEKLGRSAMPLAVDVERAQGFRYGSSPYLLQLRREDVGSFLIDTAELSDLTILQPFINAPWILHDASQDLPNLRELGLRIPELFDTQIASRLGGLTHFGLSAVCEQLLGLALLKDHQAANWSVRPLPKDWLRYAVLDVELLTALKDALELRLEALGRLSWAQQEFSHIAEAAPPKPKKDRWRSIPGIGKLTSKRALAIARELWFERDAIAQEIDLAPGRLVRNSGITLPNARLEPAIICFRSQSSAHHKPAVTPIVFLPPSEGHWFFPKTSSRLVTAKRMMNTPPAFVTGSACAQKLTICFSRCAPPSHSNLNTSKSARRSC